MRLLRAILWGCLLTIASGIGISACSSGGPDDEVGTPLGTETTDKPQGGGRGSHGTSND